MNPEPSLDFHTSSYTTTCSLLAHEYGLRSSIREGQSKLYKEHRKLPTSISFQSLAAGHESWGTALIPLAGYGFKVTAMADTIILFFNGYTCTTLCTLFSYSYFSHHSRSLSFSHLLSRHAHSCTRLLSCTPPRTTLYFTARAALEINTTHVGR